MTCSFERLMASIFHLALTLRDRSPAVLAGASDHALRMLMAATSPPAHVMATRKIATPLDSSSFLLTDHCSLGTFFHTSIAFTIVPSGTTAPGPTNAPAAIQQPSPISIGSVIRSKVSLLKSWLPVQRNALWEMPN